LSEILLFAYCVFLNRGFEPFDVNPMLGPKLDILLEMGAKDSALILQHNQWWRLITPVFLHLGVIHLAVNLLFQLTSGADLERHLGHTVVIFVYFISGLGGNLASAFWLPSMVCFFFCWNSVFMFHNCYSIQIGVGASSALFGLVATILVDTIKNWSNYDSPLRRLLVLMVMLTINVGLGLLPLIGMFLFCFCSCFTY
jgi:membrane associated rhomboid family serine protease